MTALETLLAGRHEIGDGELHRALRDLQSKYLGMGCNHPLG